MHVHSSCRSFIRAENSECCCLASSQSPCLFAVWLPGCARCQQGKPHSKVDRERNVCTLQILPAVIQQSSLPWWVDVSTLFRCSWLGPADAAARLQQQQRRRRQTLQTHAHSGVNVLAKTFCTVAAIHKMCPPPRLCKRGCSPRRGRRAGAAKLRVAEGKRPAPQVKLTP